MFVRSSIHVLSFVEIVDMYGLLSDTKYTDTNNKQQYSLWTVDSVYLEEINGKSDF